MSAMCNKSMNCFTKKKGILAIGLASVRGVEGFVQTAKVFQLSKMVAGEENIRYAGVRSPRNSPVSDRFEMKPESTSQTL